MLKKILNAIRRRGANPERSSSASEFIAAARSEMQEQSQMHAASWQYGKEQGWSADMGAGVISFKFANGATGTAHFQVIGIYDEIEAVFSWGWAHPSVPSALRAHAILARQWGRYHQDPAFTTKSLQCVLEEVWDFAAVTNSLAGSKGVYRGHSGTLFLFLTLGQIHIETDAAAPHWAALAKT